MTAAAARFGRQSSSASACALIVNTRAGPRRSRRLSWMETSSHGPLACSAAAQNQPSSPVSSPVQATVGRVARSDGAARRKVRQGRDGACHRGRWNGADAAGYGGSWRWWSVASVLFLGHCSNRPGKAKATRAEEYKPTAAAAQGDCLHARVRHKICWLRTFLFARMLLDDLEVRLVHACRQTPRTHARTHSVHDTPTHHAYVCQESDQAAALERPCCLGEVARRLSGVVYEKSV